MKMNKPKTFILAILSMMSCDEGNITNNSDKNNNIDSDLIVIKTTVVKGEYEIVKMLKNHELSDSTINKIFNFSIDTRKPITNSELKFGYHEHLPYSYKCNTDIPYLGIAECIINTSPHTISKESLSNIFNTLKNANTAITNIFRKSDIIDLANKIILPILKERLDDISEKDFLTLYTGLINNDICHTPIISLIVDTP